MIPPVQRRPYFRRLIVLLLALAMSPVVAGNALSRPTYERLLRAHELLDAGNHRQAVTILRELLPEVAHDGYQGAMVLRSLGHAHAGLEQYNQAIEAFRKALGPGVLDGPAAQRVRLDLGRLLLVTGAPADAIEVLSAWLAAEATPGPEGHVLLANGHAMLGQHRAAITAIRAAIAKSDTPEVSWYRLLLSMQYALGDYAACTITLERLLHLDPARPDYWTELAGMHLARQRYRDALAVMELAWVQGHLSTATQLLQLVRLYAHEGAPYKAGTLLATALEGGRIERSAEHLALLGAVWNQARERARAIQAYAAAAGLEPRPVYQLPLVQFYLDDGHWESAAALLEQVLAEPGLDNPGEAWLLLGFARHELGNPDGARDAFRRAAGHPAVRDAAKQWLARLDPGS